MNELPVDATRRGMALPAAIGAVCMLAALAALASFSAQLAVREAAALHAEAQADATRDALRVRAALALGRNDRAALLTQAVSLGGSDTMLVVSALAWPWHRVEVSASGAVLIAEAASARPPVSWCAAAVSAGVATSAAGGIALSAGSGCATALVTLPVDSIAAFTLSLERDLVLSPITDTLVYAISTGALQVIRASRAVSLGAGAVVTGVVAAPTVRIASGAVVRGIVVAADTLVVESGASVLGDEFAASAALAASARLRLVGRRGLLLPP